MWIPFSWMVAIDLLRFWILVLNLNTREFADFASNALKIYFEWKLGFVTSTNTLLCYNLQWDNCILVWKKHRHRVAMKSWPSLKQFCNSHVFFNFAPPHNRHFDHYNFSMHGRGGDQSWAGSFVHNLQLLDINRSLPDKSLSQTLLHQ